MYRLPGQGGPQDVEIPGAAEIRASVGVALREQARTFKWMRLPEILFGTPAASAITLGVNTGQGALGPEQGYAWCIRRLVVSGLTSGGTPDVVNLFRNDRFSGPPLWQFNGNNFGYTFGRYELTLFPGDTLSLQNVGTITSTSRILLSGELEETSAERIYEMP